MLETQTGRDSYEKDVANRIEKMTLEEARTALASGKFGQPPDSPLYLFASGILAAKESAARDANDASSLAADRRTSRYAMYAAVAAIIALIAAMREQIVSIIFG